MSVKDNIDLTRQRHGLRLQVNQGSIYKSKRENTNDTKENKIRLGTWNVRGTFTEGALKHLIGEMKRYNVDILAIQETKQRNEKIMEIEDYIFFNSGKDNRMLGVGFIVSDRFKNEVIEFEGVSDRMCRIRIRGKFRKISIINSHAPSEEKDPEIKTKFYEELERILGKVPRFDIKFVMGDMNAKVGREEAYKEVTGGKSKHISSNDNGKRTIEFAFENNMKIVSTTFDHKNIHKETWISPSGRTRNQIDHVLVERKHAKNVTDVRSYRGADADSDHMLVIAEMKQERPPGRSEKGKRRRKRYDVDKLKEATTAMHFEQEMRRKLEIKPCKKEMDEEWAQIETVMEEVTKEILGKPVRKQTNKWFDGDCKKMLERRNKARLRLLEERNESNKRAYERIRREAKTVCRRKKKEQLEQELEKVEESYANKEIRNFYQEVKKNKGNNSKRPHYLKTKEGDLVGDTKGKLQRFAQYFSETLNETMEGENKEEGEMREHEIPEGNEVISPPTKDEVVECIKHLKNNKSAGENNITAEILKNGGETLIFRIWSLIKTIWEVERMPEKWNKAIIIPLHKKGAENDCNNYRGIALQDVTYKVLAKIIRNRLEKYHNEKVGEYQGGFKAGRSTIDQIFIMKQIQQNTYEQNLSLHCLFVDYRQAYDSINRKMLSWALRKLEVPEKLRKLVQMTVEQTKNAITMNGEISEEFVVMKGLRQGDPLSTVLFNLVQEVILRESGINTKGIIYGSRHQCLAYADDIVLMARSKEEVIRLFKSLEEKAKEYGLTINENKTKYMVMKDNNNRPSDNLVIHSKRNQEYTIEKVEQIEYLGVTLTNRGDEEKEIEKRLAKGSRAAGMFASILNAKNITRAVKLRVYQTIIRPTVTYACETWTLTKKEENKLEIWERKILRRIFGGIKVQDEFRRRTNREIYELYKNPNIAQVVRTQRARWLGHIARMSEKRWVKRILMEGGGGKRRRGRPRKKWLEEVLKDMRQVGVRDWKNEALDRKRWKRRVKNLEAQGH